MVAERVGLHLTHWVLKEEMANQKIASLQSLVDWISHNDGFTTSAIPVLWQ